MRLLSKKQVVVPVVTPSEPVVIPSKFSDAMARYPEELRQKISANAYRGLAEAVGSSQRLVHVAVAEDISTSKRPASLLAITENALLEAGHGSSVARLSLEHIRRMEPKWAKVSAHSTLDLTVPQGEARGFSLGFPENGLLILGLLSGDEMFAFARALVATGKVEPVLYASTGEAVPLT